MNYLISEQHCFLKLDKIYEIFPKVKYSFNLLDENLIVYGNNFTQIINFYRCENVEKLNVDVDNYYFLNFNPVKENETVDLNFKNKTININSGTNLKIIFDGNVILNSENLNVRYSHFEKFGGYLLIYFVGDRNYFVCIKDDLVFASFYDEVNIKENERYFMCRLFDSLNQGRVYHIKDTSESYLVYLDDNEMCLKNEFCAGVFLDCVMSGNLKYANNLLTSELTQKDEKIIKTFFPEFDSFFILDENLFVLKNKNALSGTFRFFVENNKITNIIQL